MDATSYEASGAPPGQGEWAGTRHPALLCCGCRADLTSCAGRYLRARRQVLQEPRQQLRVAETAVDFEGSREDTRGPHGVDPLVSMRGTET